MSSRSGFGWLTFDTLIDKDCAKSIFMHVYIAENKGMKPDHQHLMSSLKNYGKQNVDLYSHYMTLLGILSAEGEKRLYGVSKGEFAEKFKEVVDKSENQTIPYIVKMRYGYANIRQQTNAIRQQTLEQSKLLGELVECYERIGKNFGRLADSRRAKGNLAELPEKTEDQSRR
jgi:hypothetical protein